MEIRSDKFPISTVVLIAAIHILLHTGCARIADPQPPRILVPKTAMDLTARQMANSIILSVSLPDQNTDGSQITTLERVDIFRIEEISVAEKLDTPLPEKQFLTRASRIQSIPRLKFPEYLNDKILIVRDEPQITPESSSSRSAFRYAVAFINNKGQAAGLSNQVIIQPIPIPLPPQEISGEVTENAIRLKWAPPSYTNGLKPEAIAGYNIYRSEQPDVFSLTPINPLPVKQPEFEDQQFQFNKTYYYAVSTVGSIQNPFAESLRSKVLPVETRDIFPPSPAKDLHALFEKGMVLLLWAPSPSPDVAGYRITRQEPGMTEPQLLQKDLIRTLSFRDVSVEVDKLYEYSIQAIDAYGNESMAVQTKVNTQ